MDEDGGVEFGDACEVLGVYECGEVAELGGAFDADILVLMVVVFVDLAEADGGESELVEGGVVAASEVAVWAEDEFGFNGEFAVEFAYEVDVACELA